MSKIQVIGNGFSANDVLAQMFREKIGEEEEVFFDLTKLDGNSLEQFKALLKELKRLNAIKTKSLSKKRRGDLSVEKGACLEKLVRVLLLGTSILEVVCDVGTATNEIDLVVSKSFKGVRTISKLKQSGLDVEEIIEESHSLLGFKEMFLVECKNHGKKIQSTWVGKFNTLMNTHGNFNVGIIFSYYGLTGNPENWTDAHGLTKLIRTASPEKRTIIEFNILDYERIENGENFFRILNEKLKGIAVGADFSKYEIQHKNKKDLELKVSSF